MSAAFRQRGRHRCDGILPTAAALSLPGARLPGIRASGVRSCRGRRRRGYPLAGTPNNTGVPADAASALPYAVR